MDEEWERFQKASYIRREPDVNRAGDSKRARPTSCSTYFGLPRRVHECARALKGLAIGSEPGVDSAAQMARSGSVPVVTLEAEMSGEVWAREDSNL
jgi:hypothetical protein